MPRSVALLVLALLLAGCASQPPGAVSPAALTPAPASPSSASGSVTPAAPPGDAVEGKASEGAAAVVDVTALEGKITSAALASGEPPVTFCCPGATVAGENVEGALSPKPALRGIVVELAWADPTMDLDLFLFAPDYVSVFPPVVNGTTIEGSTGHGYEDFEGRVGAPDNPARVVVTDPEALALAGAWTWGVGAKLAQDTPFTIATSLFYGEPPPETYTAFAR